MFELVAILTLMYLLTGVALAQLAFGTIDRSTDDSDHYWLAITLLILFWPKALYDISRKTQ